MFTDPKIVTSLNSSHSFITIRIISVTILIISDFIYIYLSYYKP